MAEILIKAVAVGADPGHYQRGDCVVAMPDGHVWGNEEGLPLFVVIKVPLVSVEQAAKYVESAVAFRRRWRIRVDDLPASAKQKLAANGELTIKAKAAYAGEFDYTWTQVKAYFRDLVNAIDESAEFE